MSSNVRARAASILLACGPLFGMGCRCAADPQGSASSEIRAQPPECARGNVQLTLTAAGGTAEPAEQTVEPALELPFSIEPGMGISLIGDLFATGLRHEARGAVALLAKLGAAATAGEVLELGRVHGDVAPPRLAADGSDLVVALQEATASGHDVRLARLENGRLDLPLTWRVGPHQANDESNLFDIAARQGLAVIVWDDWLVAGNHSRILAATVSLADAASVSVGEHTISAPEVDAEAPRLTARPGGFWLAWLVNAAGRAGAARVYDPGGSEADEAKQGSAYGARWIEVVPLDAQGRPEGEVRRLAPSEERVVGYDLTTHADGSAWLAWRQAAASPAASGGRIVMAELHADGTQELASVRDGDVGSGEPSWLVAAPGQAAWLTFPDRQDRTLLMRVESPRVIGPPLRLGAEVRAAAALAASGERVLFAAPRGRAIELFPATCTAPKGARRVATGDASVVTDASPSSAP